MVYKSFLGKKVELTSERKKHILLYHPDLEPYFSKIRATLVKPDEIRLSKSAPKVLLFYRYFDTIFNGKYIAVAVKTNDRWFVLTAYLTKRKLSGEKYEQK